MKERDAFASYHPVVNFIFFGLTIGFTMFLAHPCCQLISLVCAVIYYARLKGRKAARLSIRYALPTAFAAAVINPAFNHKGAITLFRLPTGNSVTLESVLYGLSAAVMLSAVLFWFGCYSEIMTSDKFTYLFGRIIPATSLILSMALRFVPKFKTQFLLAREAREGMGVEKSGVGIIKRIKNACSCFSVTTTWALENAVDASDSMKSRGYGLSGRTAFSIYTLCDRDKYVLCFLALCGFYLFSGSISGGLYWRYFPSIRGAAIDPLNVSFQIVYLGICMTPIVVDVIEERKWKYLRSKI